MIVRLLCLLWDISRRLVLLFMWEPFLRHLPPRRPWTSQILMLAAMSKQFVMMEHILFPKIVPVYVYQTCDVTQRNLAAEESRWAHIFTLWEFSVLMRLIQLKMQLWFWPKRWWPYAQFLENMHFLENCKSKADANTLAGVKIETCLLYNVCIFLSCLIHPFHWPI